jgi:riboflavin kinase
MRDTKLKYILLLSHLLLYGAKNNFVEITTTDLAKKIDRSQQLASKELLDLELIGLIERNKNSKKFSIRVTEKGFQEVCDLYLFLKTAIETFKKTLNFEGEIISGMGEGSYYMSLPGYKQRFKETLGYEPYPGTLNIKLNSKLYVDRKKEILKFPSILIDGFSDKTRTYGWVKCYPAFLNQTEAVNGTLLILERTHYDDTIIEIIAPFSIKDKFNLKNGDLIKFRVKTNNLS